MKRLFESKIIPITSGLAGLIAVLFVFGVSAQVHAAKKKGKVVAVVEQEMPICQVLKSAISQDNEIKCDCQAKMANVVAIIGELPKKVKPGKAVILKAKGSGKIMGEIVAVVDTTDLDKVAEVMDKKGAGLVWIEGGENGRIVVIKIDKAFSPDKDVIVQLKVKSKRVQVEGC